MKPRTSRALEVTTKDTTVLLEPPFARGRRLEELTAGEGEAGNGGDRRTLLLHRAHEEARRGESVTQDSILNALPAQIALLDAQGLIVSVNEAWRRFARENVLVGAPDYGVGQSYLDVCDAAEGPEAVDAHQAAEGIRSILKRQAEAFSMEYCCHSPTEKRWFRLTVTPLADEWLNGAVVMHLSTTEARLSKEALEQLSLVTERRERLFSSMLSSMSDFAQIYDQEGRLLFANQPLLDLWGLTLDAVVGKNFFDLGYPEDLAARLQRQLREVVKTKQTVTDETRYSSPSGQEGYYEYIFAPVFAADGTVDFVVGSTRDITERKLTAEALRKSLNEFRTLTEAMPQMVWMARPDGWSIYFSRQWMDYTGLALEESLGRGWSKAFHPDDEVRAWTAWKKATASSGIYSMECRLRRADGAYRWWLIRGVPMRDETGTTTKWFGTCTDIHDLKMAQLGISESEQRFAKIFNSHLVAIGITEASSGQLIDANERFAEFFGYTRAEMIGRTVVELGLWADAHEREGFVSEFASGRSGASLEAAYRMKSGEIRQGLIATEPLTLPGTSEPLRISMVVDMTERKRLEAQLLQAQKMDAVGRLAGGVAHDFNNSLGVILGYTELLIPKATEAQRGKLGEILKATNRASGLTRQLLAFSRKQVVDPKVLDLNARLAELTEMLGRLIGEHIQLAVVPGEDLGQVRVDLGQFEQVVMNLCVNARDAMPAGGVLRIETINADFDAGQIVQGCPVEPGRYVLLAVSDTGCGIAKEVLSQIFEPFFTTKEQGKGTGLGLAMVYGIVKQALGYVWVESEVGSGTTFRVYLPRVDEPLASEAESTPMPTRGWETVLLVEDEASLRAIARELLEDHGYRVLDASGGDEALDIARRHPEPIHLLVTDVVMPRMNGRVLAESLVALRPGLEVLYMSGYTDDVIAHSGVLESGTHLIEKPFTARALLLRVAAALGKEHEEQTQEWE